MKTSGDFREWDISISTGHTFLILIEQLEEIRTFVMNMLKDVLTRIKVALKGVFSFSGRLIVRVWQTKL